MGVTDPDRVPEGAGVEEGGHEVAVLAMSCRFPGAANVDEFWDNLSRGVESITVFSDAELRAAGVDPRLVEHPRYVKAKGVVDGEDLFDAAFFGLSPREAQILDPQHRFLLECAWEAFETAGYDPYRHPGPVGVYAGAGTNSYAWTVLNRNPALVESVGLFQATIGNEKDYLPTLISYKLNLRGPSFSIQCACSTSLVAIHQACQALVNYECDLALAGGVTLGFPQRSGYLFQEGGILSPDGHCRPFDARARGTAPGSGAGMVLLKRLREALDDGDQVLAVIRGSAVNNDGAQKVGFTAPSVDGQSDVIAAAQEVAGVEPEEITYVEAHGTATPLGDPIEVTALTQVFRDRTAKTGFCRIGSVKSNVGHLDTAAGVAGFIKTVLALRHRRIPPTLHFERPNPAIDFAASPFTVAAELSEWESEAPLVAAVSSFGIGGTNAHVILEEAPAAAPPEASSPYELLVLSARTAPALEQMSANLAARLAGEPELSLGDVAHTLQLGRAAFEHRRVLVARSVDHAARALGRLDPKEVASGFHDGGATEVAFLFPGQGAQYVDMALELYRQESVFRSEVDRAAEILEPHLELDLRRILYPAPSEAAAAGRRLSETRFTQPALFVVEYALARQWSHWGVEPGAMIGHSIGEFVAACLAGVLTLEDALALVATRGRLMQSLPRGAMTAISLSPAEVASLLPAELDVAAVNAPELVAVSGPDEAVAELERRMAERGVRHRRLHTSHAFHSAMTEPILEPWAEAVGRVRLAPPRIPYLSNLTGDWIGAPEATSPDYWVRQMRRTVLFHPGVEKLLARIPGPLLEVGPGRGLRTLIGQHPEAKGRTVLGCLRHPRDHQDDRELLLTALGRLWIAGVPVGFAALGQDRRRRRVPLPTYPFERERHWVDPAEGPRPPLSRRDDRARPEAGQVAMPRSPSPGVTAPRDEVEIGVAEIWEELLGVSGLGVDDDFFAAGGTSLLAVSLMERIEDRLGRSLPVSALSRGATIEGLARQIRAAHSETALVELRGEGEQPPLFWVHPIGGNVLCYVELVRCLSPQRPVYGFRAVGLEPGEEPHTRIEDMALHYLALLRERQPEGPYRLGGWSFGGLVAFEMASLLEEQGERVEMLSLLDSWPLTSIGKTAATDDEVRQLVGFFQDLSGGRLAELGGSYEDLERLAEQQRFDFVLERAKAAELLPVATPAASMRRLFAVFKANAAAAASYRPRAFRGDLLLFRAAENVFENPPPDPEKAWRKFATGSVETHVVPAHHYSMMSRPFVEAIAEKIDAALEKRSST